MSDRVAEALAALEAASEWGLCAPTPREQMAVRSFSALLKLATLAAADWRHITAEMSETLDELADAVLGAAPTPEEHRAP